MTQSYLIVGANGLIGQHLISTLAQDSDHRVFAATRKTDGLDDDARDNVQWRHLDLSDKSTYAGALDGIDRLFVLSPGGNFDAYGLVQPLLKAAVDQDMEHIVLMTAMGVQYDDSLPLRKLELYLEQEGVSHTVLRPGWFMQNFQTYWHHGIQTSSTIALPAGQALTSFIDTRDIAEAAAEALKHKTQGDYDLTGGEALSYTQAAKILSGAADRDIHYQDIDPEQFKQGLAQAGLDEPYIQMMLFLFQSVRDGHAAPITTDVKTLTGHAPRTLEQYAQDHAEHF